MQKSLKISLIVIGAIILLLILWLSNRDVATQSNQEFVAPTEDPIDAVSSFYNQWLEAEQSTTTDPIQAGLHDSETLTPEARENLVRALAEREEGSLDPVFCQLTVPERVGAKELFILGAKSQVMVLARGGEEKSPYQAIVSLEAIDGAWRITEISCSQGETAPEREFSFDREGFLLKSVPPPLDPNYWHIVFEENGIQGHTAPLFFGEESMCISNDGTESICDESQFTDATKVILQGEMTESGVNVKRVNFAVE